MDETVADAAESGDPLRALVALRDTLATAIDGCNSNRDLAALSLRLVDVLAEITKLAPPDVKGDDVDEIAARYALRRAGTAPNTARAQR